MKITYIEHSCFMIETKGKVIVIDPYMKNPENIINKFPQLLNADFIILSHGHEDHTGSLYRLIGKSTCLIGVPELCSYFENLGIKHTYAMNFGGTAALGEISVSLVKAEHTSSLNGVYLGEPAGIILKTNSHTLYHFGDTSVFGDMSLIQKLYRPDIGLIPIGGRYTMNADHAAFACNEFFNFDTIIPMHYNTFDSIRVNPEDFSKKVNKGNVRILSYGETLNISD